MNAMETRKLAQELGIKNAAKFKKDVLERKIAEIQAERSAAQEREEANRKHEAEQAQLSKVVRKSTGKCIDCGRKADPNSPSDGPLCTPHLTEAEHQNSHDNGHEDIHSINCWICWPELNEAAKLGARAERQGTSREGMRMTVPVRGAASEKAAAVIAKLPEDAEHSITVDEFKMVHLTIVSGPARITLAWHADGAYAYDATSLQRDANSKIAKVRNASAALRFLGV
jgi:hypothetical protein